LNAPREPDAQPDTAAAMAAACFLGRFPENRELIREFFDFRLDLLWISCFSLKVSL
jgi:hypothetical protein